MDISYLQLFQMLLIIVLIFGLCRISVSFPRRGYVLACVLPEKYVHPVYYSYRLHIHNKDLYAFDKYQIWRYIEKRKSILLFG